MQHDNLCQRLRRAGVGESDESMDHDAEVGGDVSAMPTAKMAMFRSHADRLRRCPHCGSESIYRWGKSEAGVPRGRCLACERTFSPRTGTWIAGIREAQKFAHVLDDMLTKVPGSCRRLAGALDVDKMTVWHWRRKISQALVGTGPEARPAPVAIHDEPIRESRKGSREWVDHHRDPARHPAPNRPRWVDVDRYGLPLQHALVAYQLRILVMATEGGCQAIVAPLVCPSAARHFCDACETVTRLGQGGACPRSTIGRYGRHAEEGVVGSVLDGRPITELPGAHDLRSMVRPASAFFAVASRARTGGSDHSDYVERAAPATANVGTGNDVLRTLQQPTLDSLVAAFGAFLRPFAGPAAKYLEAYAAWFIKRLEGSDEGRLERAWMQLMA